MPVMNLLNLRKMTLICLYIQFDYFTGIFLSSYTFISFLYFYYISWKLSSYTFILTYTFIILKEKYPPTLLLCPTLILGTLEYPLGSIWWKVCLQEYFSAIIWYSSKYRQTRYRQTRLLILWANLALLQPKSLLLIQ